MAGHLQHLKARNGRFPARVLVHWALRPCLDGKAELEVRFVGGRRERPRRRQALQAIAQTLIAEMTSRRRGRVAFKRAALPN